jgi:hypothetical protein
MIPSPQGVALGWVNGCPFGAKESFLKRNSDYQAHNLIFGEGFSAKVPKGTAVNCQIPQDAAVQPAQQKPRPPVAALHRDPCGRRSTTLASYANGDF